MTVPPSMPPTIAIRMFDAPRPAAGAVKILLLKLGERIGDFVTAMDAFKIIRAAFPAAEITFMCLPEIIALAQSSGLFDRVVGFGHVVEVMKWGRVHPADPADQLAAFAALLDSPYFLAADFRHDGSTRGWLDHVDADYRAGFMGATQKGLDIVLPMMEWRAPAANLAAKNLPIHAQTRATLLAHAIVETLGEKLPGMAPFPLPQGLGDNPSYAQLREDKRLKIGIGLGAGAQLRQWPTAYWAALAARLLQGDDALFVFFGGEADKAETQAVVGSLPPDRCIDLTGALKMEELPAFIGLLHAYIGCDTGLTHLAAKLGVRTVNIFAGISNVSAWRAQGAKVKTVYAAVPCAPCHFRFPEECTHDHACMKAIHPDIVFAAFRQIFAS